jgi:uncharacterized protein
MWADMVRKFYGKKVILRIILSLFFIGLISSIFSGAKAEPIPNRPAMLDYVYDYADLIETNDENIIKGIASTIDRKTKAQIVVVTVNDLDGRSIEDYSLQILREWGIGDREKNNGVLILVNKENLLAKRSGKIRIEVGYGLEGVISDGIAGYILDTYAIPAFEDERYSEGIKDTFMAIASEVAKEYDLDFKEANLEELNSYIIEDNDVPFSVKLGIIVFIIILILILPKRKTYRRYRSPFDDFFGGGGFGGGGFGSGGGGFGGGSGGGGGASR